MNDDHHQPVLIEAYDDEIEARRSPTPPRPSQPPLPPPNQHVSSVGCASNARHSRDCADAEGSYESCEHSLNEDHDPRTCAKVCCVRRSGCDDHSKRSPASYGEDDSALATAGLPKVVDHTYRDFSRVPADGKSFSATPRVIAETSFPTKLHEVLSKKEYGAYISWMAHGRAFRVHVAKRFEAMVCPKFFKNCRYSAFLRHLNNWGFKRITQGRDRDCYYHEAFLYGLPHLTRYIVFEKNRPLMTPVPKNEPDFYQMNALCPLPYLPSSSNVPVAPTSERKSVKVWPREILYSKSSSGQPNGATQLSSLLDAKLRGRASRSYAPSSMDGRESYASAGPERNAVYGSASPHGRLDDAVEDAMATKTLPRTDGTAYSGTTLNEHGGYAAARTQQMGTYYVWQRSTEKVAKDSMSGKTLQASSMFGTDYVESHVKKKLKCSQDDAANANSLSISGIRRNEGDDAIDSYYLANLYGCTPSHQMMFDGRHTFGAGGGSLFYGNSSAIGEFGRIDEEGVSIASMQSLLEQKRPRVSHYSGTLYGSSSLGQNDGATQDAIFDGGFSMRDFEGKLEEKKPDGM